MSTSSIGIGPSIGRAPSSGALSSIGVVRTIVRSIAQTLVDSRLDVALARGLEKVLEDVESPAAGDPAAFLQSVSTTISSRVGGTVGADWAAAFRRAAVAARGHDPLSVGDAVTMLRAAIDGIQARDGARLGDGTLLDALVPAVDALVRAHARGLDAHALVDGMAEAARAGAEATRTIQTAPGQPDTGAVVVALIAERLAAQWPTGAPSIAPSRCSGCRATPLCANGPLMPRA
ncbi:DAK2 domain-containing protein [Microbacterium sp. 18062]|uniref:DAK2 domain-containing protein n=1 Tax=Microbacterium sp. 18062 TaxID=2681410 RepID=UPI001359DA65|nr:DAK2 domain-containing protein [Microbacterium sp. 18062]